MLYYLLGALPIILFASGSVFGGLPLVSVYMGVSENRDTLFWGPYNKDPTI